MKVADLNDILGIPARLAIVASLARGQQLTFTALGDETGIADGNLHVQTRKLVDAGILSRESIKSGGRNATRFAITDLGCLEYRRYVQQLREALAAPADADKPRTEARSSYQSDPARVW